MQIIHRIGFSHREKVENRLDSIGVNYEKTYGLDNSFIVTFEIGETDPNWPVIKDLLKQKPSTHFIRTEFSQEEILDTEWLIAFASYLIGYPAPKKTIWDNRYTKIGCMSCGRDWKQEKPFQIAKEPDLNNHSFAGFSGSFVLFCTKEVIETFEANGIYEYEIWPVLLYKSEKPSEEIYQLMVSHVANPGVAEEIAETEVFNKNKCDTCDNYWYSYYTRGMLPFRRDSLLQNLDFQLTHEWFGNGRTARRLLLVSNRLARLTIDRSWKGLEFLPIKLI